MGPQAPGRASAAAAGDGVAIDAHALDRLHRLASEDPARAVKQVATQFEALFMQMVLKSMREATPRGGLLDSPEQQTYTGMLDEQLAQKIAQGGTGLGAVIARQLGRNLGQPPADGATPAVAPLAVPAAAPGAAMAVLPPATPGIAQARAAAGAPPPAAAGIAQVISAARAARLSR